MFFFSFHCVVSDAARGPAGEAEWAPPPETEEERTARMRDCFGWRLCFRTGHERLSKRKRDQTDCPF